MKDETATAMSYWKHNPTFTYYLEKKAHFYLQPSPREHHHSSLFSIDNLGLELLPPDGTPTRPSAACSFSFALMLRASPPLLECSGSS